MWWVEEFKNEKLQGALSTCVYEWECRQGTFCQKKKRITSLICSRRDLLENRSRISKLEWDAKILPQWRLPEVRCSAVYRECNTET